MSSVNFNFTNGEVVSLNVDELNEETVQRATVHGLLQKIGDAYSGVDTVEEGIEAAKRVIGDLVEGNWKAARSGGGGPRVTQLAGALARIAGKTVEEAQEMLKTLPEEKIKALKASPKVKAVIAQIKAETLAQDAEKDDTSLQEILAN